jgi:predicted glycosyltransferase involved in capsule biosynthesis
METFDTFAVYMSHHFAEARKSSLLIMAMKWKCLDLKTKFKVIRVYEVGSLSKSKIERWYVLVSTVQHKEQWQTTKYTQLKTIYSSVTFRTSPITQLA